MIAPAQTECSNLKARSNFGYIWLISAVAALGGLVFGWDWVVIGGAKPFFQRYFQQTSEAQIGWTSRCALLGCRLGSPICGGRSDKMGRKKLLIISALLLAVSSVLMGWAFNFDAFVFSRIAGPSSQAGIR